jgi:hypothetical protein
VPGATHAGAGAEHNTQSVAEVSHGNAGGARASQWVPTHWTAGAEHNTQSVAEVSPGNAGVARDSVPGVTHGGAGAERASRSVPSPAHGGAGAERARESVAGVTHGKAGAERASQSMRSATHAGAGAERVRESMPGVAHGEAGAERARQSMRSATHGSAGAERVTQAVAAEGAGRATQSVPPAVRRRVLLRDHHTCQVPGCRNILAIDVHHILPRAEGGTHHAHNQLGLCTAHHRAVHRGALHVSGRAPDQLVFQHADGSAYGGAVSAAQSDVCRKVYDGLCWLGFKSSDARRALAECAREGEVPRDAEGLLRRALERLA